MRRRLLLPLSFVALSASMLMGPPVSGWVPGPGGAMAQPSAIAPVEAGPGTTTGPDEERAAEALEDGSAMDGSALASAEALIGKRVLGADGAEIGEVTDVILTAAGEPEQIVLTSGGFLGLGAKQVALAFDEILVQDDGTLSVETITLDEIEAMPEFEWDDSITSLGRGGSPPDTAVPAR
ncbi:PRC-barrel domain-containing protein [Arenibaculum pallidiluteum]|uniref:PRC-barrel domain-containing protein n=1 Tax=Arenibaculum pallidiluteum TaxID=2812559 RepID=UPI001A96DCF5|nr:PRC-barrel domain-containing protein [Arenibaculum pallidiluteum]